MTAPITPLDLAALRVAPALAAAEYLAGLSRAELAALAGALGLWFKLRADKQELISTILAVTHPHQAVPVVGPIAIQERMF